MIVSVVCPIYNEEKFIASCLDSILEQDFSHENLEIILVDGMSSDNTRNIIAEYNAQYPFIKVFDNPYRTVPYAMNIGIQNSVGQVIVRLDLHCKYPNNYISTLVKYLFELNADNVGSILRTVPADDTSKCLSIAFCLSHWFGVGNSMFRIGASEVMKVDTVPFGCFKREVFDKVGLYDLELTRNQDDELNGRIINHGGNIYLIPELVVDYTARNSFSKLYKMYYQYGLFKPLGNKKLGSPATIRQFAPPIFVLGLILGTILSIFVPYMWIPFCGALLLYLLISFGIGIRAAIDNKSPLMSILVPYGFLLLHCSYGIGYWHGILKLLFHKPFNVQSNH